MMSMNTARSVVSAVAILAALEFAASAHAQRTSYKAIAKPMRIASLPNGVVPGAFICPDLPTLETLQDLWQQYLLDQYNQSRIPDYQVLHGKPMAEPAPGAFGCALAPAGTEMKLVRQVSNIPIVRFQAPGKKIIEGVAHPNSVLIVLDDEQSSQVSP